MNIDFKADAERQIYVRGDEELGKVTRVWWKHFPVDSYRIVCVKTAERAVPDYWQMQRDKFHRENPDWEPMDYEEQLAQRAEAEFRQGQRDVETWREDKQLFGTAAAEQMQLNREYNEY